MSGQVTIAGIDLNDIILNPFADNSPLTDNDKDNIVQEYKKIPDDNLPVKADGTKIRPIAKSWKYPGTTEKMTDGIPKIWTMFSEDQKKDILTKVLNKKLPAAATVRADTGTRREPPTTADDYARALHVCKSNWHTISQIHQIMNREELDARKSKQKSVALPGLTVQDELNGWRKLVDIFNDTDEYYHNFTWDYDADNNKVASETRFVGLFDRVKDIDPNNAEREERDDAWFKKTWTHIKSTMSMVLSKFEQSGRHNADDDQDDEFREIVEQVEVSIVHKDSIGTKMMNYTNLDWVLYGFCLYDKFECNFGKVMDNNAGKDSERGSASSVTSTTSKRRRSGSDDGNAIADAISDGMANDAQITALQYLAEHGDQDDRREALDMIRRKAGLARRN